MPEVRPAIEVPAGAAPLAAPVAPPPVAPVAAPGGVPPAGVAVRHPPTARASATAEAVTPSGFENMSSPRKGRSRALRADVSTGVRPRGRVRTYSIPRRPPAVGDDARRGPVQAGAASRRLTRSAAALAPHSARAWH